jgi:flagellar biosynthesis/type III secretory pathway M-ring protein FliF/YscJ
MIAIYFLLALVTIGVAFLVWRTFMRSPKTDKLFDTSLRDEEVAGTIIRRRKNAEKDLKGRERTLSKRKDSIQSEISEINKHNE